MGLLLAIFFSVVITLFAIGKTHLFQQHAEAWSTNAEGQGMYEGCQTGTGQTCLDRLTQMANAGMKLVINYNQFAGNADSQMAYANKANSLGMKIIWGMSDSIWWDGTDLRAYFPGLAATCNCTDNSGFITYVVNLVKNQPATWGYYIADEPNPANHDAIKAFSDLVHQTDPDHPRLVVSCANCDKDSGHSYVYSLTAFVDTADVIGVDWYPISNGDTVANTAVVASELQSLANQYGKDDMMVLQAFSWYAVNPNANSCSPWPSCSTWPTVDQMTQMKTIATHYANPRFLMWYSYFTLINSDNPTQHMNDLIAATGNIALRGTTTGNNGSGGTTLTIANPTGTLSGDVMVAHVIVRTASNTITAPNGWSLIRRQDSSSSISTATYRKVAGSSEPTSYTWTFGTAGEASGGIASYTGVNTTTPVDASNAQYNASTSNVDNAGVTTTVANDLLVYTTGITTATIVNVPSGFSEKWSTTSNSLTTSEMSQEYFPSIGATGLIHGTHNGGTNSSITHLIALKPAYIPISPISGNGLSTPKGVVTVGNEVWVVNNGNNTISRFNADGSSAGSTLSGNGLNSPYDGAVVNNQVWIVNAGNNSISRFNTDGSSAGSAITGNSLSAPKGIVVVGSQVWVSDSSTSNISRFNFDGTSAGSVLDGNGLSDPRGGVVVNSQVWIPNQGANTISRFNTDGTSAGSTLSGNGLNGPEDSALITVNGNQVWFPNYWGSSISVFNTDGTAALGSALTSNSLGNPHGVTQIGSQIWVPNSNNNTISVF